MAKKGAGVLKILFLVTTKGHGRGGHFYSIKATAEQMARYTDVTVLNIGTNPSPVVACFGGCKAFLNHKGFWSTYKHLLGYIRKIKPNVIHAFDFESFFFARLASLATKTPLVLTKCGGPNPIKYFPYTQSLVLYSIENMTFFEGQKKYADTRLYLIPNRVSIPKQDAVRSMELRAFLNPGLPVFLRIARISKVYRHSILQTIHLVKKLNADGLKVQLLIVGTVQDKGVFNELLCHKSEDIVLVTADRFTANASELIDIADFVVGTGRGFMEAALLGKVMLSPNRNLDIPVVATQKNIDSIANLNFSERPVVFESEEEAFRSIKKILYDENERQRTAQFTKQYAINNFHADPIYKNHIPVYCQVDYMKVRPFDLLVHGYLTWKTFSHARR